MAREQRTRPARIGRRRSRESGTGMVLSRRGSATWQYQETKGRTIADQAVLKGADLPLQLERLDSREDRPDSQIQLHSCSDSSRLKQVEIDRIPRRLVDLPARRSNRSGRGCRMELTETHAGMMALNRARLTTMLGLALRQTSATTDPMYSPSRSQSVQIIKCVAFRASARRFDSMPLWSASCAPDHGGKHKLTLSVTLTQESPLPRT